LLRILRICRLWKRGAAKGVALSAVLAIGLSGCITDRPSPSSDEPLLQPTVYDPKPPIPRKLPGDGPITTSAQKRAGGAFEPQVQFGDGEFVQEPKGFSGLQSTGDGEVELNFAEANVREVAQSVLGTILGQNVVVDAGVEQRITLRTSRPIQKSNLLPTLETTLAAAGLALVKDGELYRILPAAKAKGGAGKSVTLASDGAPPSGSSVTVVRLEHIAPSQMAKILEPLAPEKAILRVDDPRNILILSATGPEMKSLLETIDTFDVSALKGMSVGYFKLQNAKTQQVAGELKDLIKAYGAQSGFNPPQIVPIDRLNVILVFASQPQTLKLTQRWIQNLDSTRNEVEPAIYVYRVKNRKAKELAPLLANLFQAAGDASNAGARGADTAPDTRTVEISNTPAPGGAGANAAAGANPADTSQGGFQDLGHDGKRKGSLRILADNGNNSLLIRATPAEYQSILSSLVQLDTQPALVMVDVTIAEVTLTNDMQYGVEWLFKNGQQNTTTFSADAAGAILSKFPGFSYFFNAANVKVVLNAMAGVTNVKVLSSPKVMVLDNKTATLQIGDQIPVVTSNVQSVAAAGAPVVQTVQYFDTGVILKVTPQVNSGGLVTLDINQEVSNVASGASAAGTSPTIQQRKINSSIAIQSGEAVVLGGLIRDSKTNNTAGIPLLSDIPGAGEVFKTHDNDHERTELILIITPKVVWDRSDARDASDEIRGKMQAIYGRK
jgi:general secretion pathway protein D